jgi:FkbM family methyltransferase
MDMLRNLPHVAHKFGLSYRMRPVLKAMGVDLRPIESTLDGQRSALLDSFGVTLVVDGGAHVGAYGKRIRSWGYRRRIVSFEPNPESFRTLTQVIAKDPDWAAVNVGLSTSRGSSELYLHGGADSPFNSLHETSAFGQHATGITSSTLRVELDTLDHLLLNMAMRDQCTWLKLDLQGHEISALHGATQSLARCVGVEVEVPMDDALYAETASTKEQIFEFLNDYGFRAIAFHTERWFGGSPPDMDVLFTRCR